MSVLLRLVEGVDRRGLLALGRGGVYAEPEGEAVGREEADAVEGCQCIGVAGDGLDPTLAERPVTIVRNKIDLTDEAPGLHAGTLRVSAVTGAGLAELRAHLIEAAGWRAGGGTFSARRRHLDAIARARRHLVDGLEAIETRHAGELLAEELRLAQHALGEITGAVTTEDLLGRIFASFCIGK